MTTGNPDWFDWHAGYAPGSGSHLVRRLAVVQRVLSDAFTAAAPGPLQVGSLCAGQGDDLLGVLAGHERTSDVTALLVEADDRNVQAGTQRATDLGFDQVEFLVGDAGNTSALAAIVPCDVLLLCGMFGNISMDDIARTIATMPTVLAPGATVIWTRRSVPNDLTPAIRATFAEHRFTEIDFVNPDDDKFTVGSQRLDGEPQRYEPGRHLFEFVGFREMIARGE